MPPLQARVKVTIPTAQLPVLFENSESAGCLLTRGEDSKSGVMYRGEKERGGLSRTQIRGAARNVATAGAS